MQEIINNLWVGNDQDYEDLDKRGWHVVRACKEGPGGHRDTLGYDTLGAPTGKDYLYVERGNRLALNLIDHASIEFIPVEVIRKAVEYIKEQLQAGNKTLVACNHGRSRSATIVLLYLHAIGDVPESFTRAVGYMHKIYEPFDPGTGMLAYAKKHW
jgi:hypothetical protein